MTFLTFQSTAISKSMHGCRVELQDSFEGLLDSIKCGQAAVYENLPIPREAPSKGIGKFSPMPPDSPHRALSRSLSKSYVTFDDPQPFSPSPPNSMGEGSRRVLSFTNKVAPTAVPAQDDAADWINP